MKTKRGKFDEKAIEGTFLRYDNRSKGCRIYTGNNRVVISRAVKFLEHGLNNIKQNENNTSENIKVDLNVMNKIQVVIPQQAPVELRWSI